MIRFVEIASKLVPGMIALETASTPHPWSVSMLEGSVAAKADCWHMCEGAESLGYLVVQRIADEAELLNIVVFKPFQNRGYGGAVLHKLQQELAEAGVQQLFLEVRRSNVAARALYVSSGFKQLGVRSGYYRAGHSDEKAEDALLLVCELSDTYG